MPEFIVAAILKVLSIALPPVIMKYVVDVVKYIFKIASPKIITMVLVPVLSAIAAIVGNMTIGANTEWTFILSMLSIAVNEILNSLKPKTETE